ncbi:MAG TPA: efflux RND transporter periplasmic adaptor subunit, partial [Burkholderiales bacterium]|nr:efflux RND transporter periplasmic adaptor subunit [Burkholderiales bacterium]
LSTGPMATKSEMGDMKNERKVLYWYDPMAPNQHFDKPGKSPSMDMQLVPMYADEGGNASSVKIDPSVVQNLGIRLALVERGMLAEPIVAVANVVFNDRDVAIVQARSGGFIEKVYARAPGDVVHKGAPIADLLIPEWAGAQTEFLATLKSGDENLAIAARERLKLLGMPTELINRVEQTGKSHPVVTISTPVAGVIQTLDARTGMTISSGMTLAKINGLDTVWLEAAIPEAQGGLVSVGKLMEARLPAYPGKVFKGKVIAVLPATNVDSHTLRVRIELPNRDGQLKPGMYAQVRLDAGESKQVLFVPSEAIIRSGRRNLVLIALDGGRFQPVEVDIGHETEGKTVILKGLKEGQKVVASGQFLIDSEANLKGVLARLGDQAPNLPNSDGSNTKLHDATGKVEKIASDEITISHGPVKSIGLGPMTRPFKLAKPEMAASLNPGDTVSFGFRQSVDGYVIEKLDKIGDKK